MPSYPLLKQGDHLPTVGILQKLLNRTGLGVAVDGVFGPRTRAALIQFQNTRRLPRDGIAGAQTWERLVYRESLPVTDCVDVFDPMLMNDVEAVTKAGGAPLLMGGMSGGVTSAAEMILAAARNLFLLRFIGHGKPGLMAVSFGRGGERLADGSIYRFGEQQAALHSGNVDTLRQLGLQRVFGRYASVELHGCRVAQGVKGRKFVTDLANVLGVPVTASPNAQYADLRFDGGTFTAVPHGKNLRQWCAALPDFPGMSVP